MASPGLNFSFRLAFTDLRADTPPDIVFLRALEADPLDLAGIAAVLKLGVAAADETAWLPGSDLRALATRFFGFGAEDIDTELLSTDFVGNSDAVCGRTLFSTDTELCFVTAVFVFFAILSGALDLDGFGACTCSGSSSNYGM